MSYNQHNAPPIPLHRYSRIDNSKIESSNIGVFSNNGISQFNSTDGSLTVNSSTNEISSKNFGDLDFNSNIEASTSKNVSTLKTGDLSLNIRGSKLNMEVPKTNIKVSNSKIGDTSNMIDSKLKEVPTSNIEASTSKIGGSTSNINTLSTNIEVLPKLNTSTTNIGVLQSNIENKSSKNTNINSDNVSFSDNNPFSSSLNYNANYDNRNVPDITQSISYRWSCTSLNDYKSVHKNSKNTNNSSKSKHLSGSKVHEVPSFSDCRTVIVQSLNKEKLLKNETGTIRCGGSFKKAISRNDIPFTNSSFDNFDKISSNRNSIVSLDESIGTSKRSSESINKKPPIPLHRSSIDITDGSVKLNCRSVTSIEDNKSSFTINTNSITAADNTPPPTPLHPASSDIAAKDGEISRFMNRNSIVTAEDYKETLILKCSENDYENCKPPPVPFHRSSIDLTNCQTSLNLTSNGTNIVTQNIKGMVKINDKNPPPVPLHRSSSAKIYDCKTPMPPTRSSSYRNVNNLLLDSADGYLVRNIRQKDKIKLIKEKPIIPEKISSNKVIDEKEEETETTEFQNDPILKKIVNSLDFKKLIGAKEEIKKKEKPIISGPTDFKHIKSATTFLSADEVPQNFDFQEEQKLQKNEPELQVANNNIPTNHESKQYLKKWIKNKDKIKKLDKNIISGPTDFKHIDSATTILDQKLKKIDIHEENEYEIINNNEIIEHEYETLEEIKNKSENKINSNPNSIWKLLGFKDEMCLSEKQILSGSTDFQHTISATSKLTEIPKEIIIEEDVNETSDSENETLPKKIGNLLDIRKLFGSKDNVCENETVKPKISEPVNFKHVFHYGAE